MAARFLIKDRENKPYALVEILPDGAQFHPVVAAAKSWSKWMADEYAGKKISKEELTVTLDNSMSLETTVSDSVVEELKNRSLTKPSEEIEKKDASAELVPVISLMDIQLSEFPVEAWKNAVQYKAVAFIADQNKSSFTYEVKRTRAVWDPSLAVPGTERRGGFRCPVGTRYGGQITDRFGRQCGWGVARRLANEISDLGERLENVGDRRRERRVTRRNERMARRLAQGGAIERGARAVGDALDFTGVGGRQGGQRNRTGQPNTVKPGRVERAAGRLADVVNPDKPARNRRAPARPRPNPSPGLENGGRGIIPPENLGPPRNPRRRPNLRDSEQRRMEREIDNPGAPRTGDAPVAPANRPRPAAPRRPANPRPARPRNVPVDNTSKVPVPAGAPSPRESLDTYKTRKYNEHQAEVRRIRDRGGNAGFLRREEWERFHGPAVEQAWRDRNPDAGNAPARPRPNGGRGRRTGAAAQNGRRPANRRPRPNDQPDAVQPAAPRPRRPRQFTPSEEAGLREELNQLRRDRDQNVPGANRDARIAQLERILGDTPPSAPARPPARPAAPARPPVRPGRRRNPAVNAEFGQVNGADNGLNGHAPDRFDQKLGHKVVDGVLVPDHVAVGNAGINNAADAALHLRNGGSLDDVPDMLVKDAIFENAAMPRQPLNGKRFQLMGAANSGINDRGQQDIRAKTYMVVDQVTGKRYIMKSPSWVEDEAVGEQYAAIVGQLAGRPMGRVRVIGPREERINNERGIRRKQNHAILVEHFGDALGLEVKEGSQRPANPDRGSMKYVQFIDAVMGNPDRHDKNYMWAGNEQLPIDHGIVEGGTGIVPIRTPAQAQRIWASVDSPQIRTNFRNLSDAKIANIVAAQKEYWRSVGLPSARVTQNAQNMTETLRNLAEAARR
jgi:hypothetical protein